MLLRFMSGVEISSLQPQVAMRLNFRVTIHSVQWVDRLIKAERAAR